MSRLYDDEMVEIALDMCGPNGVILLDTVAPLIAAKALRAEAQPYVNRLVLRVRARELDGKDE